MRQMVNSPTRVARTSSTCIDLVLTNALPENIGVSVVALGLSDHYAQLVKWQEPRVRDHGRELPTYVWVRDLSDSNLELVNKLLAKENWDSFSREKSLDGKLEFIQSAITYNLDLVCPIKRIKIRTNKKKDKGWVTPGIINRSKELRSLDVKRKTDKTSEFEEYYKNCKRIHRQEVIKAKSNYMIKRFQDTDNLSKEAWKNINDMRGIKAKRKNDVERLVIDEKIIDNKNEILQEFNRYFSTIGEKIHSDTKNQPLIKSTYTERTVEDSLMLAPTDEKEIEDIIRNLKNKHSKDIHGLSNRLIRTCAEGLCGPLSHLINASFEKGAFPTSLKKALVQPIYKSGPNESVENYRPVSIVSTLGKVIEIAFLRRLESFAQHNSIIYEHQYGFMKNKSTSHAIVSMITDIVKSLDKKLKVINVLLDLRKAFDCVSHPVLMQELYESGIRGNAYDWIHSYLTGRSQIVQGKTSRSVEMPTNFGVPQGSVLGPTLFNLYINKLAFKIQHTKSILYADDIVLSFSNKSMQCLEIEIHEKLANTCQYLSNMNLEMNTVKTSFVEFKMKESVHKEPLTVTIDEKEIREEEIIKYLGLDIDSHLVWSKHIDVLCGKISSAVFVLRRLRTFRNEFLLRMFYTGVIESKLRYGIAVWGGAARHLIQRLFILQKRAVRIVAGLHSRESCRETFKNKSFLTLCSMYLLEVIMYARFEDNATTGYMVHDHNTRARSVLRQQQHRSRLAASLPQNVGACLFNVLPDWLKRIGDRHRFKNALKKYLAVNAFYSVEEFKLCH